MGAFHNAVRRRHLDEVRHLVHDGADVNAADAHGNTPLMLAAARSYRITKFLLENGASDSIHYTNNDGKRAIDLVKDKDDDILDLLDEYMVEVVIGSDGGDDDGPGVPMPDGNI
ncbi:hypothetical protein BJX61DRAFT_541636 [Aspergillus egyptiacus]|nr:hypothetical protein BJX61DRAFT_541636 [Aspergillus egyptiacus]